MAYRRDNAHKSYVKRRLFSITWLKARFGQP